LDPDVFLTLEITKHGNAPLFLGILGSITAAAHAMIPEENRVFDPEMLMTEVIHYTHYMPDTWKGKLHSQAVS